MAHSHAKANRQRDFISIVIPLGVCSSAHSEDQKECQQYFNPHCLCRGHAGAWDSRTQCPAFLFRCDVFQYCWASDTLWRIERYDIIVFGQCEFAACLIYWGFSSLLHNRFACTTTVYKRSAVRTKYSASVCICTFRSCDVLWCSLKKCSFIYPKTTLHSIICMSISKLSVI